MAGSQESRIAALEAELAELRAKISPPAPANLAPPEEGTRVTYSYESPIALPSLEQCEQLLEIVSRSHPKLKIEFDRDGDRNDFVRSMRAAFFAISHLGRSEELNQKKTIHDMAIEAETLWHRSPFGSPVNGFLFAIVASGDIAYSLRDSSQGLPARTGLTFDGRPATEAWRQVLERGAVRPPVQIMSDTRAMPRPSVHHYS